MRRSAALIAALVVVLASFAIPAGAQAVDPSTPLPADDQADFYEAEVTASELTALEQAGLDIPQRTERGRGRFLIDLVLSRRERREAEALGVEVTEKEAATLAAPVEVAPNEQGFEVWRDYSGPGGFAEELQEIAAAYPELVDLEVIGQSVLGQDILAARLTGPGDAEDRPAVLYNAVQHAREWIAGEVNIRLLKYMVDNYASDPEIAGVVDTTELWFVPIVNPDGYDYTFVDYDLEAETGPNRLWRKNLRDNDGDGAITGADGVDLNRNWPEKWGYDNEGSSPVLPDATYRGTGPASEPETQALAALMDREQPAFHLDYHSYVPALLYPYGWQQQTRTADDPIFEALSGTDAEPAVEGYDPDVASELYITNGSVDDYSYFENGTIVWTPELDEGVEGAGFEFPDDEALVQAEFERNVPFALDLAKSAHDPANPVSHLGNTTPDFEPETFTVSYGSPQTVEVNAKRELGPVLLRYKINGGRTRIGITREYQGGERYYGDDDVYYHRMRGQVRGAQPGDEVEVWFETFRVLGGRRARSESFTYSQASDTGNDVLVVAAEDYTGLSPAYETGTAAPRYAATYLDALATAGYEADLYDMDANGRTAPHPLGVLSHYDAVVIETGDDVITRSAGQVPGTAARVAFEVEIAARDYLNDGGKLLYAGKYAGFASGANGLYSYNPEDSIVEGECTEPGEPCLPLTNDFLQYWLGAYSFNAGAGLNPETEEPYDLAGTTPPFVGATYSFAGGDGVDNQDNANSFLTTSSFLPPEEFPQFASSSALEWLRTGGAPYEPLTGEYFAAAQTDDEAYKRLTRTVDLTGVPAGAESGTALLEFAASYDLEAEYDYVFVEAHPVGSETWTTLPAVNAETGDPITSTDVGQSCLIEWNAIHPFLDSYQTLVDETTCVPTGTTGEWNAATGNSGGWQPWQVDLSAYAGQQVEVSISHATDFASLGIGLFVDDASVTVAGTVVAETSFEEDLGGWAVPGPPPGSPSNDNDWIRSQTLFSEGAATATEDTLYFGFGIEGLATSEQRADIIGRAMAYLLDE